MNSSYKIKYIYIHILCALIKKAQIGIELTYYSNREASDASSSLMSKSKPLSDA